MNDRYSGKKKLGNRAEDLACRVVKAAGCKIIRRNFALHDVGEIDLIAEDDREVVFIEVRSASTYYLDSPAVTVNHRKQTRIVNVARVFLHRQGLTDRNVRFDVIAVWFGKDGARVEWIKDAFRPRPSAFARRFQS